jgi:hypothetical protein
MSSERSKVFVAMPFNESFVEVYEDAVRPAVIAAEMEPLRVDELIGHRNIVDDIEQGISESLLVFADFTTQNPNVFYEIGFARAIGRPLVVATQDDTHVPFDLRQRRYIKYRTTGRGLESLRANLTEWFRQAALEAIQARTSLRVHCHGTKFDVPNRNQFWNDLLAQAHYRFYLLGRSNKSWINKSERQSTELAESIVRILGNGGTVRILSDSRPDVIASHKRFIREHVLRLWNGSQPIEVLGSASDSPIKYVTYDQSNYGAVVSDDRLVLLPTLNSSEFRDETLVLEIFGPSSPQLANYLGDIDRLIRDRSQEVNILG